MATGVDSLGQFQFGDIVQIDPQTVGVIVQIQKENFQVVNSGMGNILIRNNSGIYHYFFYNMFSLAHCKMVNCLSF